MSRPDETAAIDRYRHLIVDRPALPEGYNNLGVALMKADRNNEALWPLAMAIRLGFGPAHFNLGNALFALERWPDAVGAYRRAVAEAPGDSTAYSNLAAACMKQCDAKDAFAGLSRGCQLDPLSAAIRKNLGNAADLMGRPDWATLAFSQAAALDPGYAEPYYALGNVYARFDRQREAAACFRVSVLLLPTHVRARSNWGIALQALDRTDEAIGQYRLAVALRPDLAYPYSNLGAALDAVGRTDDALPCLNQAIRLIPHFAEAHANLGKALLVVGRLDDAHRSFQTAVHLAPRRAHFYRALAECGRLAPADPQMRAMEALAQDMGSLPEADQVELHFALGTAYTQAGRHERSFRHLAAGNRLRRQGLAYDETATFARFARIRAVFDGERVAGAAGLGHPSPLPVFILGMPRSGTTLVEQILASHPSVSGVGETGDLRRVIERLGPYPDQTIELSPVALRRLGADIRDELARHAPDAARIIEKTPQNFEFAGLIHMALPAARTIHVVRDPLDTCLSCFSKLFLGHQPYCYDLGELGRYYRQYLRLMAHWRRVLPADALLEVRYEDIVADCEAQARRLVAFCGLDWDERCIAFHRNPRPVRTASALQVRQPVYGTAVGRWRVYSAFARPLLDALDL